MSADLGDARTVQLVAWRRDQLTASGFPLPLAVTHRTGLALRHPHADRARRARLPAPPGCAYRSRRWTREMRHDPGYAPYSADGDLGYGTPARRLRGPAARRGVARVAALPARRGLGQGGGGRPTACAPPARCAVRGRAPPADAAAPARERPRRHREPGGRRRARERPQASGRLPRRQPLHDVGLQVRAARGGGQAEKARLAGPRGPARAGDLEPASRAPASSPTRSWSRASCWPRFSVPWPRC